MLVRFRDMSHDFHRHRVFHGVLLSLKVDRRCVRVFIHSIKEVSVIRVLSGFSRLIFLTILPTKLESKNIPICTSDICAIFFHCQYVGRFFIVTSTEWCTISVHSIRHIWQLMSSWLCQSSQKAKVAHRVLSTLPWMPVTTQGEMREKDTGVYRARWQRDNMHTEFFYCHGVL